MNREKLRKYFLKLIDYSSEFMDRLPIESEPQPLDYVLNKLKKTLYLRKSEEIKNLKLLNRPLCQVDSLSPKIGTGLNSIGMLTDRLTILIIKECCNTLTDYN